MSYRITADIQLRPTQTGLTLKARLVDSAGSNVGGEITTGFVEIGRGTYLWDYSAIPDGHRGGVKILNSADDSLVAFASIAPEDAENLDAKISTRLAASSYTAPDNATITAIAGYVDTEVAAIKAKTDNLPSDPADESDIIAATTAIMSRLGAPEGASVSADVAAVKSDTAAIKVKTDTIGAGKVTAVSPVSVSGDMQVVRGDAYSEDDGASRVFEWSDDDSVWPAWIADASLLFKCGSVEADATFVAGTPNKIQVTELTAEQTTALPAGRPIFKIISAQSEELLATSPVTVIIGSVRFVAVEGLR